MAIAGHLRIGILIRWNVDPGRITLNAPVVNRTQTLYSMVKTDIHLFTTTGRSLMMGHADPLLHRGLRKFNRSLVLKQHLCSDFAISSNIRWKEIYFSPSSDTKQSRK